MLKVSSHGWIKKVAVDSKPFHEEKLGSQRRLAEIKVQLVVQTS